MSQSLVGTPYIAACGKGRQESLQAGDRSGKADKNFGMTAESEKRAAPAHKISVFGREFRMPRSRAARIGIGVVLVILGIFGFLPVLGFWMVPLGLLILSYEFASVRRLRRRFIVWWERRRSGKRSQ